MEGPGHRAGTGTAALPARLRRLCRRRRTTCSA